MDKKVHQEHEFLKERIKKTPVNGKRLGVYIGIAIMLGAIAGVVAALVFYGFGNLMGKDQEDPMPTIVLSEDTEELELVVEEEEKKKQEEAEPVPEEKTDAEAVTDETVEADVAISEEEPGPVWSVDDYQELQNQLYAIGEEANSFVVSVTGVKETEDWFHSAYETEGIGSGIIIAESDEDYRIVTERRLISDVSDIKVTFQDNESVSAKLIANDETTGIAVLRVVKAFIPAETREKIQVAMLGASSTAKPGTVIVAIGSPQGTPFSILTGNVISADQTISMADANYRVLTTDITGQTHASGALVGTNGHVLGLVLPPADTDSNNTVTALGITDLRKLVEKLSNGVVPVYMGLEMSEVTQEVSDDYGLPEGIYVKSVLMDSPAMYAGIQTGDVIQSIDGEEILTEAAYTDWILNAQAGVEVTITLQRMGADGEYGELECIAVPK